MSVNTYGVNDLVARSTRSRPRRHAGRRVRRALPVGSALCPLAARHVAALCRQIEMGCGFQRPGGFQAFTTNFEDLGGLRQLPGLAVQRLMADGYGFGGEGDWKTRFARHVKADGGRVPGGTSFMEDYTYHFGARRAKILGAHMLEVCPSIAAAKPTLRNSSARSAAAKTRCDWCSMPPRAGRR